MNNQSKRIFISEHPQKVKTNQPLSRLLAKKKQKLLALQTTVTYHGVSHLT